jgi:hypothetical protein
LADELVNGEGQQIVVTFVSLESMDEACGPINRVHESMVEAFARSHRSDSPLNVMHAKHGRKRSIHRGVNAFIAPNHLIHGFMNATGDRMHFIHGFDILCTCRVRA